MSEVKKRFIERFGEEQALFIEMAAHQHVNENHILRPDGWDYGDDPFSNCIFIVIGFQCVEVEFYRKQHNITVPYKDFIDFCKENKTLLRNANGDIDHLTLLCGGYDFLLKTRGRK